MPAGHYEMSSLPRAAGILMAALLFSAACSLRRGPSSSEPPPQGGALSPEVSAALDSILAAARRLDAQALAPLIASDYSDSAGRVRQQLLTDFRRDQDRFVSAVISVDNVYSQDQEGAVLLRFRYNWRGAPKIGQEKKLQGGAEWLLKEKAGVLQLSSALGDLFIGVPEGE